jgi:hypothetical protein
MSNITQLCLNTRGHTTPTQMPVSPILAAAASSNYIINQQWKQKQQKKKKEKVKKGEEKIRGWRFLQTVN